MLLLQLRLSPLSIEFTPNCLVYELFFSKIYV